MTDLRTVQSVWLMVSGITGCISRGYARRGSYNIIYIGSLFSLDVSSIHRQTHPLSSPPAPFPPLLSDLIPIRHPDCRARHGSCGHRNFASMEALGIPPAFPSYRLTHRAACCLSPRRWVRGSSTIGALIIFIALTSTLRLHQVGGACVSSYAPFIFIRGELLQYSPPGASLPPLLRASAASDRIPARTHARTALFLFLLLTTHHVTSDLRSSGLISALHIRPSEAVIYSLYCTHCK